MKRLLIFMLTLVVLLGLLCGCNEQIFDTTYSYERAIVALPGGRVVEGECSSWKDWEDGTIQVVIDDMTYYTHSANVILISE